MRPQDREWPAWHPNSEVRAQHLLGLEDFLLARAGLADEDAHGVEDLDWRTGVAFEDTGESLVVRVKGLRGVTPAGEPVDVPPDPPLAAAVPGDRGRSSEAVVDLWVEVNVRRPASEDAEAPDPPKLALRVDSVTLDVSHPLSPGEAHSLYLGRYRWLYRGKEHELVHRPLVRRLGSFAPHDAAWDAWVQPLRSRIEAALAGAEQRVSRSEPAQALVAAEAARLAFEWPALPLPALARRLRLLSWLGQRALKADVRPAVEAALLGFSVASGEQTPEALARLLAAPSGPVREASTLHDCLGDLLRALGAVGGVDYHAPGRLLSRWVDELTRLARPGSATGEAQKLYRDVEEALGRELQRGAPGVWTRGVALLTASACEDAFREPFPRQTIGAYVAGGLDVTRGSAAVLGELYRDEAQNRRAGPLAFYWLAQAAARLPEVAAAADAGVGGYLRRLGAVAGGGVSAPSEVRVEGGALKRGAGVAPSGGASTRALQYLTDRLATPSATSGTAAPSPWQSGEAVRRDPLGGLAAVRVVLVGPPGSGKTTLLRQFPAALASPGSGRLPARLGLAPASDSADGVAVAKGEIHILGRTLPLTVADVPGALLEAPPPKPREPDAAWPPLHRTLRDCDLLVLTLDPRNALGAGASSPAVVQQVRAVEWALRYKPALAVAVAYTKADEYGVVSPQATRLVEGASQSEALRKMAGGDAGGWQTLIEGAGPVTSRKKEGSAVIGKQGAAGPEREWSATRRKLLEETRPLWESLLRAAHPPPLLNGYFVAAEPSDRVLEPPENRGLLPLVADFLAYLSGGR
jgi:hypothetical protein